MDRVTILQGRLVIWVLAAALALAVAVVVPRATSAAPPEPVDETPIPIEGICDFPLQAELQIKCQRVARWAYSQHLARTSRHPNEP
jgi:hypothetical protein